jgi:hypothetical protein
MSIDKFNNSKKYLRSHNYLLIDYIGYYLLILTPDCLIVNVKPAIEIVPVRVLVVVFADIAYTTVPLPEPLMPDFNVIQEALLDAFQAQPL